MRRNGCTASSFSGKKVEILWPVNLRFAKITKSEGILFYKNVSGKSLPGQVISNHRSKYWSRWPSHRPCFRTKISACKKLVFMAFRVSDKDYI